MSYDGEDGSVDQSQWEELKWRRDQMERNWPKNQFGSLLTPGEWEAAQQEIARLKAELAESEPNG